ncbi:Uncharacterised protein [Mycobacteroides abscessus subsp. abscessus]|nr:Uncharacterised protein [Mycobacteroides abscessus subsp. abscessus]
MRVVFSLLGGTGVSTVITNVLNAVRATRSISSSMALRSPGR